MQVGILGGGRWGQALGRLVMSAGHQPLIAYRDERPPQILPSSDDPPSVSHTCELLLVATSASALRRAIRLAQPGPSNRVVVAGRGVEPATGRWLTQVVTEECDALRVGALAGPAPVAEILNGGLCSGVVASPFSDVQDLTTTALHSSRYRVYQSADLTGVQLAGAVVPVLATLMGMARSLRGSGLGMYGTVLARGLEESARLAGALGADPMTLSGLAGVGSLVASQAVPGHPSYEAGVALAAGDRGQGPSAIAQALVGIANAQRVELPLTEALVSIYAGEHPVEAVQRLMSRAPTAEHTQHP